jgi:hypothetical protein
MRLVRLGASGIGVFFLVDLRRNIKGTLIDGKGLPYLRVVRVKAQELSQLAVLFTKAGHRP